MIGLIFLVAAGPALPDDAPLPRYLDDRRVSAVIRAALPAATVCGASAPGAVELELRVGAEGGVLGVGPPEVPACWVEAARGWIFPAHDDDPVMIRVRLASVTGEAPVLLESVVLPRDVGPLFLYLPSDLDPERRAAIDALLGFGGAAAQAPGSAQ